MNPTPDSPESEPHSCCSGEGCQPAGEQPGKSFGKRGAAIAGSLGLVLASCESGPLRDPGRMTVLYGPPPMAKNAGAGQSEKSAPKTDAPATGDAAKSKKAE